MSYFLVHGTLLHSWSRCLWVSSSFLQNLHMMSLCWFLWLAFAGIILLLSFTIALHCFLLSLFMWSGRLPAVVSALLSAHSLTLDFDRASISTVLFTRGPFGLRVLSSPVSVCVCVCVSVCLSTFACPSDNSSHVPPTITWFGQKDAKHFAYGAYCFGGWLNINFQVKFNFISKSCLFASLLRPWNICETCKNGW